MAIKACPMRKGGKYTLTPRVPVDAYRGEAESQPTRARSVLCMIDKCEAPVRTVTITVTHPPERHGNVWLIRFAKGDRASDLDRPIFLSKYGDYTMSASKQAVPGDPEVQFPFAEDLAKARAKTRERRASPQRQLVNKMQADVDTLRTSLATMKARNRLRRIEHDLKTLALELPATGVLDSPSTLAGDRPHGDVASHERPPKGYDARDSRDADAEASRGVLVRVLISVLVLVCGAAGGLARTQQ
jgi:hypothetical protein